MPYFYHFHHMWQFFWFNYWEILVWGNCLVGFGCTGQIYTYSTGNKQHLYVNHPELVKEMNQCITFGLGKPSYITKRLAPLLGNGILRSNGHFWAQQRKIVAPEFFMDKVKVGYTLGDIIINHCFFLENFSWFRINETLDFLWFCFCLGNIEA